MKKLLCIILILLMMPFSVSAENILIQSALQSPGSSTSDWSAIALLVSEESFDKEAYINSLKEYVKNKYLTEQKLSPVKSTEWHRIAIAVNLAGEDASYFNGINLINDGIFCRENLGKQGINSYIWALIALSSGKYEEPFDAVNKVEDIINSVLAAQNVDGSFALKTGTPDCDITAMAIYALSFYKDRVEVFSAINSARGYLSYVQNSDGSFSSNQIPNAETTAQVIIALSALGEDVENNPDFPNLYSALLSFKTSDGFSHTYNDETNIISTYQAKCAQAAMNKKCAVYSNKTASNDIIEEKQEPAFMLIEVAVSEENTEPTETETVISTEIEIQKTTEPISEKQEKKLNFYYLPFLLIVIIVIYGIIRRKR